MFHKFYVYAYLRLDGTPYYVGKGHGSRAYAKHRISVPPKQRIVFWHKEINEEDAHYLEKSYIRLFGRKDLGTGVLHNLTDGGEGASGRQMSESHRKILSREKSESHRLALSKSHTGKVLSETHKKNIAAANCRRIVSDETKRKMSDSQKLAWTNPKTFESRSKSLKGPKPIVVCPKCMTIGQIAPMKRWHFDNCRKENPPCI